jgi:hypothetical protein
MDTDSPDGLLPLSDALVRWTDPALVEAVRREERRHGAYHLHEFYRLQAHRLQLAPDRELRPSPPGTGWAGPPDMGSLITAWRALERDLAGRLVRGEFHLVGVRTAPARTATPRAIPGVWAADMRFDFAFDAVSVDGARYVAVRAVHGPEPEGEEPAGVAAAAPAPAAVPVAGITPEQAAELDPATVAALLEAHAEHVRLGLRVELAPPGKASPLALAASMMVHRAKTGALCPTMAEEADWLEAWVTKVAPSYSRLGAKRMQNQLGPLYRRLRAGRNSEGAAPAAEA